MKNHIENHRGVAVEEKENATGGSPAITNRAAYLAGNPTARALHEAQVQEFREKFAALTDGLKPMLSGFVRKAEQARQIGIVLIEFADSLPGRKFTVDFYEQEKGFFTDANGQSVPYALLEWFIKVARENTLPIDDFVTALKYKQPLLLATGDAEFTLEAERAPQRSVPPPDPLNELKKILNPADLEAAWKKFTSNQNYCPGGTLRESLRETLIEEWRPTFAAVDAMKMVLNYQG